MRVVTIKWRDRLEDLYRIADDSGCGAEACLDEWFEEWLPHIKKKLGAGCSVEVAAIPDAEMVKFKHYADAE